MSRIVDSSSARPVNGAVPASTTKTSSKSESRAPAKPVPQPSAKPKPAAKAKPKTAASPQPPSVAATDKNDAAVKGGKARATDKPATDKHRKKKLVRDSFTMPHDEYAKLGELKQRLLGLGVATKKSELLRAGVALLASLADAKLKTAATGVEVIKTGRPAKAAR